MSFIFCIKLNGGRVRETSNNNDLYQRWLNSVNEQSRNPYSNNNNKISMLKRTNWHIHTLQLCKFCYYTPPTIFDHWDFGLLLSVSDSFACLFYKILDFVFEYATDFTFSLASNWFYFQFRTLYVSVMKSWTWCRKHCQDPFVRVLRVTSANNLHVQHQKGSMCNTGILTHYLLWHAAILANHYLWNSRNQGK